MLINICQIGSLQNMQKLKFYALNILRVEIADGLQHPFMVFSGKSQNYMGDHFDAMKTELFLQHLQMTGRG